LIVKMRNVLVYGYAQVSDIDLWKTATEDVKPLREQVEHYLADIDWIVWENEAIGFVDMDNSQYSNAVQTARKMKAKGFAIDDIIEITGLSSQEISKL